MLKRSWELKYDLDLLLFIIFSVIILAAALLRASIPWDTLAYHLPFGSKLVHVAKSDDFSLRNVAYKDLLLNRFLGIPLFPYYIHGYIFRITGSMRYLTLISAIPLLLTAWFAKSLFGVSRSLFLLLCLTVPLIAIHTHTSYTDVMSGALVALSAFITIKMFEPEQSFRQRCILALGFFFLSFLCGQTKYFALPFTFVLSVVCAYASISRSHNPKEGWLLAAVFMIAALAASTKLIINYIQFGNPVYPIGFWRFSGPEAAWYTDPLYLSFLKPLAGPLYFILSLTEVDLIIRGIQPYYTLASGSGWHDKVFTAGFGFVNVIAFLLWEIFYFIRAKRKDPTIIITTFVFIAMLFINSFLTQSHLLRYWLYIPFMAILLVLLQLKQFGRGVKILFVLAALLLLIPANIYTDSNQRLFGPPFYSEPRYDLRPIQATNPDFVCTGNNVSFALLFTTVVNEGNWKTDAPECQQDIEACKCFVDFVDGNLTIKQSGCDGRSN